MNAVISPQKELNEADQEYRRLAALDSRRPGEWVRRKVQAYSAQQAAERALRESAEGRGNTAPAVPAATVARKATTAVEAVKKPLMTPLALVVTGVAVAVIALVGFLVVPSLMAPRHTPSLAHAPEPVAQASVPNSYGAASAAPSSAASSSAGVASSESTAPTESTAESSDPTLSDADSSELPPLPARAAAPRVSEPTLPAAVSVAPRSPAPQPSNRRLAISAARARVAALRANNSTANRKRQSTPATATQSLAGSAAPAAETPSASQLAPTATQPASPPVSIPASAVSVPVSPPEGFWRAAQNGDVRGVQDALASNVDVNAADAKGHRALILAIAYGHIDIVRALLAHGANPNLPDTHGATPLGAAHARGNFEILKALERSGSH